MVKQIEKYKGFELDFFICRKGFNQYNITITKYRYVGTRQEEYYLERIDTTTNIKAEARKEARTFIDTDIKEGENIVATNHPKRSWFAQITRKNGKLVDS